MVNGFRLSLRRISQMRSEEHTSELQSQSNLVCRLLLEKKKNLTRKDAKMATVLLHTLGASLHISPTSSSCPAPHPLPFTLLTPNLHTTTAFLLSFNTSP